VPQPPQLSIVIPTLGRHGTLARVLDRLLRQEVSSGFEALVVVDPHETDVGAVEAAIANRPFPVRQLTRPSPGASAARNTGWRAAQAPLVLFLDDDVMPEFELLGEHLLWHARHPQREVGVLGLVRWADELRVTPFMRWLERGVHFDFENIEGEEAGWGRFYTANVSVKRELLELVGGFDEENLPFGYEDLDLAYRMQAHGFRLLFNRQARGEHVKEVTLENMRARMSMMASSERAFCAKHPEVEPYFFNLFKDAAARSPAPHRRAGLARVVPPRVPMLGPWVWRSVDARFREALAPDFMQAWEEAGRN
jgi:GT2 family glycosyltransferase